jgi:hypothetical protein
MSRAGLTRQIQRRSATVRAPASRSLIGGAHPRSDAVALPGPVTQLRIHAARNRRNRCLSVIADPGGDLIVVALLECGASVA